MLKQYCSKLYDKYKSDGFIRSIRLLNETFVDYLFLELNTIKLKQIKKNRNIWCYSRLFSPNPLEEIGDRKGIDKLIYDIQLDFLSGCEEY